MIREALFADGTEAYVTPPEPEIGNVVQFWFRTAKDDVDVVCLRTGDKCFQMRRMISKGMFDYYQFNWRLETQVFEYYFEIRSGNETCYYDRWGIVDEHQEYYNFKVIAGFSTPDWAKGAVMYQIYVDRFFNGDLDNDVVDNEYYYVGGPVHAVDNWNRYPQPMDVREFYGGDLQGIIDKLDYLQSLGVEVIYCNPLFVSPSNHKYDTQDYDYIDPHYGRIVEDGGRTLSPGESTNENAEKYRIRTTSKANLEASNELFIRLIEEIHKRGMKIILDGVFNHCGSFNKWMDREKIYDKAEGYDKGAYLSCDSPYRNYFHFQNTDPSAWPENSNYDGWWGYNSLPKLNYEDSKELEEYVLGIAKKWVCPPYSADGWRLDVAADLGRSNEFNHSFWKKFRKVVKEANPHALILAEHYGNPSEWLQGDEWDSIMNYDAFMEPVTWFLTGMEKHSDEFRPDLLGNADNFVNAMKHHMAQMTTSSLLTAMNQLSNHDHSRFLTRTNHVVGRIADKGPEAANKNVDYAIMRIAIVMQMTWVGAPTLYYADEAGQCGFTDPDSRRTYPWGHENKGLMSFYREMIHVHRKNICLKEGSIAILKYEKGILAYGRFWGDDQMIVIINMEKKLQQVTVPVRRAEVSDGTCMARVIYSYDKGYVREFEEYIVKDGKVTLMMGKKSAIILKNKKW